MELGTNKQINDLQLELAGKEYTHNILKMQFTIMIIDKLSQQSKGGLVDTSDDNCAKLAVELVEANADHNKLMKLFDQIVKI